MQDGVAPYAPPWEQVGGSMKFEIHHEDEIAKGGDVYGMDRLRILTPKQHIEIHRSEKQ